MEKKTIKSADVMLYKEEGEEKKQRVKIILTKEVVDGHGEIVDVAGVDLKRYKKNPIVLWQHPQTKFFDIIKVEEVMGKMTNITKTKDEDGIKMITGIVEFAEHEAAQTLKNLVMMGIIKTVSIGMGVKEIQEEEGSKKGQKMVRLTKTDLFETSFVAMPSNTEAEVLNIVRSKEFEEDKAKDVIIKLLNLAEIKPKIKNYRDLFLSDDLCAKLDYEKTGDEIKDAQNIYKLLTSKEEAPEEKPEETLKAEETPKPRQATDEEVKAIFANIFNI